MNKKEGYLPFPRAFYDSKLWKNKEGFNKRDAYLDLHKMATFRPYSTTIGNRTYYLEKGDVLVARNFLAECWGWKASKVRYFIDSLIAQKLAIKKTAKQTTKQTTKRAPPKTAKRDTAICVINISIDAFTDSKNSQAELALFNQANSQANNHNKKKNNKEKEYIKKKGVKNTPSIFDFLDDSFKNSSGFCEAWKAWEEYRKERKKTPWVESTLEAKALEFMAWGVDNAIESINNSIANSWQGLFEPNKQQEQPNRKRNYNGEF